MKKALPVLAAMAAFIVLPCHAASPAPSEETAEASVEAAIAFARDLTGKATAALTSGAPRAEQLAEFRTVLAGGLALELVGKFIIGDTRASMTPDQLARYEAAFPDYLTRLYADQFAEIVGRPLEVVDARAIGERDVIVRTRFERQEGAPINVDWRVRELKSGELKAIDIIVAGVSIMLVKREEFSAYIEQHGVDSLIARLEQEAAAT